MLKDNRKKCLERNEFMLNQKSQLSYQSGHDLRSEANLKFDGRAIGGQKEALIAENAVNRMKIEKQNHNILAQKGQGQVSGGSHSRRIASEMHSSDSKYLNDMINQLKSSHFTLGYNKQQPQQNKLTAGMGGPSQQHSAMATKSQLMHRNYVNPNLKTSNNILPVRQVQP